MWMKSLSGSMLLMPRLDSLDCANNLECQDQSNRFYFMPQATKLCGRNTPFLVGQKLLESILVLDWSRKRL